MEVGIVLTQDGYEYQADYGSLQFTAMQSRWHWKMPPSKYATDHPQCLKELELTKIKARGLMSGILQQGYSLGYVFAACANLGVGGSTESWKITFGKMYIVQAQWSLR